jgi:hypothetical protein
MSYVNLHAPDWRELPKKIQLDLASRGFDYNWFTKDKGADEDIRLTILNLYVKLRSVMIAGTPGWEYVGRLRWAEPGSFTFLTNEQRLKDCLRREKNFANPNIIAINRFECTTPDEWDSRELRAWGSLHFRSEPVRQVVSVHIDPAGLASAPGILGKLDPRAWGAHCDTWRNKRWKDVAYIRYILLQQGLPKELLQSSSLG